MQDLPHHYRVEAFAQTEGPITLSSSGLEPLSIAGPAEFGGPGDLWSPETLFVASVADCFILTFRAVARASSVDWVELRCEGEGDLERIDRTTRFTGITLRATLAIPSGVDAEKAGRLLQKAETNCLTTNSLACPVKLDARVEHADGPAA